MPSIKILTVDDHPFFRQGVRLYLSGLEGFEVVGEASGGEQALEMLDGLEVDVVLLDLKMPGMDGVQTAAVLQQRQPGLRILILTSYGSWDETMKALQAGAAGYCLKDAPPDELATAIRAVAGGGTYLGRGINPGTLIEKGTEFQQTGETLPEIVKELTPRELEVLDLLAKGLGNKEIAEKLVLSEKTVKTHVANILQKLDVKTRTQAALLANKVQLQREGGS